MESSSLNKKSVSWGSVTVMGSNSVVQIESTNVETSANEEPSTNEEPVRPTVQPKIAERPDAAKVRAFATPNNLKHMLPRKTIDTPVIDVPPFFAPRLHSTPFAANRKRQARAALAPPIVDLTDDDSRDTYDDVLYDPVERGCLRTGLRLRRYSRPYWKHSGERNVGIIYGTMTAKEAQQEVKFERERRKSRYTVNQIVPEDAIVKFSAKVKLEKLCELKQLEILPNRKTLNRRTQIKQELK